MKRSALVLALVLCFSAAHAKHKKRKTSSVTVPSHRPALILLISIDQFRADYLMRFSSRFGPGGFNYLMNDGAYVPYGQYEILQNMTGPGHATIVTGAYPYQHGVPLNEWYDPAKKAMVQVYDDEGGPSPRKLLGSTVGDELKTAGYPSRVVSLSLKPRAAILMGGHRADIALWFDENKYAWASSKYYLGESGMLPAWADKVNAEVARAKGVDALWEVDGEPTGFSAENPMARIDDAMKGSFGLTFPHHVALGTKAIFASPAGVNMTVEMAEAAISGMNLGRGKAPDMLAVGLASHDYLGHAFGPNSLEMEEMTVAEDRAIARLLNYVKKKVPGGMKKVLVVLTGDHGVSPNPDLLVKDSAGGRIDGAAIVEAVEKRLGEKFGKYRDEKWIASAVDLNFVINPTVLAEKGADATAVENEIRGVVRKFDGIAHVLTATDWRENKLPPGMIGEQFARAYFPGRSGDVIALPRPNYLPDNSTANHLTGYSYDRTVPILFAGYRIKPGVEWPSAKIVDIAPTLSYLAGTIPPSLSEGRVLREVIVH